VYFDDSGLIWDAALNQTNAGNNNNKFYRIQLLKEKFKGNYRTWTRWGRVGEMGQGAILGDGSLDSAKKNYEKKFKDKSGLKWEDRLQDPKPGKYAFLERNYEDSDDEEEKPTKAKKADEEKERKPVESALPPQVQSLMSFIFNQQNFLNTMAQMSYDANKLPLGKLSKRTLQSGFEILKDLSDLISDPSLATSKYGKSFANATEELSNRYFTMIPHAFGRNRPPIINQNVYVKKEVDLLENLTDMEIANAIVKESKLNDDEVHFLDKQFQGLGMQEMTPCELYAHIDSGT
jgi:poly [ADP-ribose] polymerase